MGEGAAAYADLRQQALEAGWSDELWERLCAVRPDHGAMEEWLRSGWPPAEGLEFWVADEERFLNGTLNRRIATWADNDLVGDIYANSPETVGDWEVLVEHSPYTFAQQRLQESSYTTVVEDRRVGQAAVSRALRLATVGGIERTVMAITGLRVHRDHQGKGLSNSLLFCPGLSSAPFGAVGYWYARPDNASAPWLASVVADMEDRPDDLVAETLDGSATVYAAAVGDASRDPCVRPVTAADLPRCAELINRTNRGLDLARPATVDYLRWRLNTWGHGEIPDFFDPVYTEDDFFVVEADGQVVACGGLWDRGRNMRERWRHRSTGEEHLVETGALLDYGYAEGAAGAMAALIETMLDDCRDLGRTDLLLPIEHDAEVLERLGHLELRPDTRTLQVTPFVLPGMDVPRLELSRPATDLAYW